MSLRVLSILKDFVDLQVRNCEQLGSPAFGISVDMPMQVSHIRTLDSKYGAMRGQRKDLQFHGTRPSHMGHDRAATIWDLAMCQAVM